MKEDTENSEVSCIQPINCQKGVWGRKITPVLLSFIFQSECKASNIR